MIALYSIFGLIAIWQSRGGIKRTDPLEREQTDAIKGLFIFLVFVSHFMQYVAWAGGHIVNPLNIGQVMVAPFLFYSGYGVMESIKAKGAAYVKTMPKRRILTTLVNFDVAVIVFVVLNLVLGRSMTIGKVLLSLVCWESVGNSNWYIFVVLLCYAIAFVSALCFKRFVVVSSLMLCAIAMVALSFVRPFWWYDTILCFPVGMLFSEKKIWFGNVAEKYYPFLLGIFGGLALLLWYRCPYFWGFGWNIKSIAFVLAVVLFTKRFPVRLAALEWCGRHLFPIYIYQRIPMLILFSIAPGGFVDWRLPMYIVFSLTATFAIAALYPKLQVKFP